MRKAGQHTHLLTFERLASLESRRGADGEPAISFEALGQRWARIRTLNTSEQESALSPVVEQMFEIHCEGYLAVRPDDRIVDEVGGRYFDILSATGMDGSAPSVARELVIRARIGRGRDVEP